MEKPISLEEHKKIKEKIKNANQVHEQSLSFNDRILRRVSDILGSPWVVYLFVVISLIGFTQVDNLPELIEWFTQTFVQFVALSIIQNSSNVQSRHSEARAEMIYKIALENERDVHQVLAHQDYQNEKIERIEKLLEKANK